MPIDLDKIREKRDEIAIAILDEFKATGTVISGTTVIALISDEDFFYPFIAGPTDAQLANFDPNGRRVMARFLRELADRWENV